MLLEILIILAIIHFLLKTLFTFIINLSQTLKKESKIMKKIIIFFVITAAINAQQTLQITSQQAQEIGKKIWHNECKGTIDGLTSWNEGEEFASLGIGHFIWHPKKTNSPFTQTFPSLLIYLKNKRKKLPAWLEKSQYCPWHNRKEFLEAQRSKRMHELRSLLAQPVDLQAQFIIETLAQALTKFETKLSPPKYAHIKKTILQDSTKSKRQLCSY